MDSRSVLRRISPFLGLIGLAVSLHGQSEPPPPAAPSLSALVADIVANNPELAFYEAEIDAARAGRRAAGTREDPELSLSLGRKRVTDSAGTLAGEGTAWSVSVAQTFDWPGRISLRKAIANYDIALAELGLARFKAALTHRARTLAFGLHAAHERARAAAAVAERYRALRELFLARDPGGITPLLETRVIEAQELALQHRAVEARLAVEAALVELNQLRGVAADTPITVSDAPVVFATAPEVEAALAAARENNFEFRAARLELEQQGVAVSLARHERRPSFTVSPFVEHEAAGDEERTYGIGLSLPLPIGGRAGANVVGAEARRRQAEAALVVAQRTLEREVILAVRRYSARLEETAQWTPEAATKFSESAELADRHYRLGAVPIGTYVELQNSYLEAIDALYETRQELIEAAGALQLLTGLALDDAESTP